MKHLLLSLLALGGAAMMTAQTPVNVKAQSIRTNVQSLAPSFKAEGKVVNSKSLAKGINLQVVEAQSGVTFKRLMTNRGNVVNPKIGKSLKAEGESSAISLSEGFEAYPGTEGWQPEGWTLESKGAPLESDVVETWQVREVFPYSPEPNGTYYELINFSVSDKDEWLITPAVTLTQTPQLYYYAYVEPLFLFNLHNVDWDTFEFTSVEAAANLQVLIKAEADTEWTVVKDYFEEYKDYSLNDLYNIPMDGLEKFTIDLNAWAGQKVQVAFRYFGIDGNTMFIDDVMLSDPCLEASYSYPLGTLYYGLSKDMSALSLSMPTLPVGEELYWSNTSEESGITSEWQYQDWATNDILTTNESDLVATYYPDYSSEFTCRNNCYDTPILTISKDGAAPGSYSRYVYFQAGGRAEWSIKGEIIPYGLMPFDVNTEGLDIAAVDNDMEAAIPIYGYSKDVDKYWTDYTFNGQEEEGEGVKMTGILNYYFPTAKPIVFSEAWVSAKGQIGADAQFTLSVVPLSEDSELLDPIATATCKGSDMIMYEGGMQNFYTIPFAFEAPVVMSQDVCTAYVIMLSGFNDSANVTYFAPYQSVLDNPDGYALGWIVKEITMGGETHTSLSPLAYYTGFQSFAITIDAAYPWLDASSSKASISSTGKAEVALGSYYDGSQLTATQADGTALPEWLEATISGRYGDAKVEFTASGSNPESCTVAISGPGVKQEIVVDYDGSASVGSIAVDNAEIVDVYNVSGQKLSGNLPAGLYIMRDSNGKVYKRTIK